jgi:hypothetical protein
VTGRCGSVPGYNDHRRARTPACQPCKDAQAASQRDYEKRRYLTRGHLRIDSTGTGRRLRALAAIGWTSEVIADKLGVTPSPVRDLSRQVRPLVTRTTAAKVAALYDELSMIPGPSTSAAKRARAKGWVPPLGWDDDDLDDPNAAPSRMTERRPMFDEMAVERAMRGSEVHLRPAERAEVVRRLTGLGLSAAEIAGRLRIEKRSVTRIRSEIGRDAA